MIGQQTQSLKEKIAAMDETSRDAFLFRRAVDMMRGKISVEPIRDTNLFTIHVSDFSPDMAATIANVVSRAYMIIELQQDLSEQQLTYGAKHPAVRQIMDTIKVIKKNLLYDPEGEISAIGTLKVKVAEEAMAAFMPTGQSNSIILVLALFMSMFLSIMLAFIFEYADQTVKTPKELEDLLSVPMLGSIPRKGVMQKLFLKDYRRLSNNRSAYVGSYHHLADQVRLQIRQKDEAADGGAASTLVKETMWMNKHIKAQTDMEEAKKKDAKPKPVKKAIKTILFTGAEAGEGVSTVISNLGYYLAENFGLRVLIIDANFISPSQEKIFKSKSEVSKGLADLLISNTKLSSAIQEITSNLSVLLPGKANGNLSKYLDSDQMKKVIDEAKDLYDLILIDVADLKRHKDAVIISSYVDGTIIVVSESRSRRHVLDIAFAPLKEQKVNMIGAILNNRSFSIPSFIYNRI